MQINSITSMAHAALPTAATGGTARTVGTQFTAPTLMSKPTLESLGAGDVATGWRIRPTSVDAARAAEARGATFLNSTDATLATHRKGDIAAVLDRAGVPHAADGIAVRTKDELLAAARELGGDVRITGGFSHSRVASGASDIGVTVTGAPRVTRLSGEAALENFAATKLDHGRSYLVQAAPAAGEQHVVTAGGKVLNTVGVGVGLAAHERALVVRATDAFGLRAGGVDVTRDADGALRVLDVHATPRLDSARLEELASDAAVTRALDYDVATPSIAQQVDDEKVGVGVLNMGSRPGKNISRTLAEVERQGARPVFLPSAGTQVAAGGDVVVNGTPASIDAVLTRTGSIISDDALGTLRDFERADMPILNRADAMSLVRDKNVQAQTLHGSGVPHPVTTTVSSLDDATRAIDLIGPSMVLKNPASSEGRGVMFLDGEDAVRGVTNLFEQRRPDSRLMATDTVTGRELELTSRADAEVAVRELGASTTVHNAQTGVDELRMQRPVRLSDPSTGASVDVDLPVSVLSIGDAFRDAKPGAVLKAEQWYREASGVDTRVHVARGADGEHRVIAAMERRAQPNEFGEARSNLSLGGGATAITPDAEQTKTAIAAARAFDLDVAGVDLIASKQGPVVLEVNASPGLDIEKSTGSVADRWVAEAVRRGTPHRAARADA